MKNFMLILVILVNVGLVFFGMKNLVYANSFTLRIGMLQGKLKDRESEILASKKMVEDWQKKYSDLETVKAQVQKELKEKKVEAEDLARQLAREKQAKTELQRKLEKAEKQIQFLESEVQKEKDKSKQLEERLQRMADRLEKQENDKQSLLSRLNSSVKERDTLKDQLKKMEESDNPKYSLAEITVSEKKAFSGLILNVNEKFNFCIVSIGKNEGIVSGIELVVYRGPSLIGKITIEKVFDRMSSAKITSLQDGQMVQLDDKVRKID